MQHRLLRDAVTIRPLLMWLLILLSVPATGATVLSVGDGDTLRVSDGPRRITIRLACIDAPEMAQRPYGAASRQRLQQLAPVGVVVSLRIQKKDRYGRTVAEVFRGEQSVDLAMVRSGQAFAYRKYLSDCDAETFLAAEADAQRQRLGVWAVTGGIQRPWDFRQGGRNLPGRTVPSPSGRGPAPTSKGAAPLTRTRYTCKSIGSFSRAQELLRQGHTYLDRDGDGVACDSLR